MPDAIKAKILQYQRSCKHDSKGELIRDCDSNDRHAEVIVDLSWPEFSVPTSFTVTAPIDGIPSGERPEEWLAWATRCELPHFFASHYCFNIFDEHAIRPSATISRYSDAREVTSEIDCVLTGGVSQSIQDDAKHHNEVCSEFENAKETLFNYACKAGEYALDRSANEISRLMDYVGSCLCCGIRTEYQRRKLSEASDCFADLIRRKQTSHQGFQQSQKRLRSALYAVRPPDSWSSRPSLPGELVNVFRRAS